MRFIILPEDIRHAARRLTAPACLLFMCCISLPAGAQGLLDRSEDEVFEVVEDPPIPWLYKTTCLDVPHAEKTSCYMRELGVWLAENLEYPGKALDNKTEGMVVVQFVIDKTGAIGDAAVVHDIGDGCGQAALEAVRKMPDWIPGRQRGKPVNVRYTLPVTFKLGRE